MQLKQIVNVFIVVSPTPFCIPLSSVKSLSPSLKGNFLECSIMEMAKKSLRSAIVYFLSNISYIAKN